MKICTKCNAEKPLKAFNKYARSPDGHQPQCRECHKERYRKNKQSHYEAVKRNQALRIEEHRNMVLELFKQGCKDCGITDTRVLEFDHVRGEKVANVTTLINQGYGWDSIQDEIDKCDLVCANCHRVRTYDRMDTCWRTMEV